MRVCSVCDSGTITQGRCPNCGRKCGPSSKQRRERRKRQRNNLRAENARLRASLERIAAGPNDAPHSEPWSRAEALIGLGRT